ncbi:MAG TPA: serine hydrolase [Symbiobacteriaceae bacterium]|nr:serine hydrolase [Symbiobacteriaceae bacterium]
MHLAEQITAIAQAFSGKLGVAAINLTTGERFEYQAQHSFYPASTIKVPLLYTVFKGALEGRWNLEDKLTLTADNIVEGSGVLLDLTPGLQLSVRDVATLMIVVSDNTATNMLVDLCGTDEINSAVAELGIDGVRMNRKIGMHMQIPLGEATPAGMARLAELIATRRVLTPHACSSMIDILKRQKFKELTNRFIPESDSEDDNALVQIASKSGWIRGTRNDVAIIWAPRANYVLSMFSRDCKDRRFYHDNEGSITLARVSQAVYEAWGQVRGA